MFGLRRRKGEPRAQSGILSSSANRGPQVDMGNPTPSVRARVDEAIQEAAAFTLPSASNAAEVFEVLERLRQGNREQGPLIWDLTTGLLGFLTSVFPQVQISTLYGQVFTREPKGRGAHFDVYDNLLQADFPWVALFNLAGDAVVSVCRLPDHLAERYALAHPEASDEAYVERRRLAEEVFADSSIQPQKGILLAGRGLLIPQLRNGPEWIHSIVPLNEENPGRFVKFAVVEGDGSPLQDRGYASLDELLRQALLHSPAEGVGESESRPRRHCNLD